MSAAFLALHDGLEREGPGDRDSLDWALALAGRRPGGAILDAGCGPGADLPGLLAHVPQGRVLGVDRHAPCVARAAAAHAGDARVRVAVADMTAPPGGPFDLVWSAGAAYGPGVATCLAAWRGVLVPGGRVAFSQVAWTVPDPSAAARAFRAQEYPEIPDAEGVLGAVRVAGYRVLGARWVPPAGWAAYYEPLAVRWAALRGQPNMAGAVAEAEAEIAVWRAHGGDYGSHLIVAVPE